MTARICRTTPAITLIRFWSHQEHNPQRPPPQVAQPLGPHQLPDPLCPPPAGPPHGPAQRGTQEQRLVDGGADPQSHYSYLRHVDWEAYLNQRSENWFQGHFSEGKAPERVWVLRAQDQSNPAEPDSLAYPRESKSEETGGP